MSIFLSSGGVWLLNFLGNSNYIKFHGVISMVEITQRQKCLILGKKWEMKHQKLENMSALQEKSTFFAPEKNIVKHFKMFS